MNLCRVLLVSAALALMPRPASTQPAVVKQNVNLRAGPSSSTRLKRTLFPGDELTLLHPDTVNRYVEVRTAAGNEGWVYVPRIRVLPPDSAAVAVNLPDVFHGCALERTAQHESRKELNRLKNRGTVRQAALIASSLTLTAMLQPGDDTNRWSTDSGAVIEGYVLHVKPGGQETVNCGEAEDLYRDTHIEITPSGTDTLKRRRIIVEVTPRWRDFMSSQGQDWSTVTLQAQLVGRRVRLQVGCSSMANMMTRQRTLRRGGLRTGAPVLGKFTRLRRSSSCRSRPAIDALNEPGLDAFL